MSERPFGAFVPRQRPSKDAKSRQTDLSGSGAGSAEPASQSDRVDGTEGARRMGDGAIPDDLIEVGVVLQAYGVRGQIKVAPHAQGGDALLNARRWWFDRHGVLTGVTGVKARQHSGSVAAGWSGCDDRDTAETFKGARVKVRRSDFPALPDGEYYWVDLIGLAVSNPAGQTLGAVADLIDNGAHSVLRVVAPSAVNGEAEIERLIPFVEAYLVEVDLQARRIVVDWQLDY